MTLPKEIWDYGRRALTRKQADLPAPRRVRAPTQVFDRKAVKEFLRGEISREEMLERIKR
jgi:hypothetical protein